MAGSRGSRESGGSGGSNITRPAMRTVSLERIAGTAWVNYTSGLTGVYGQRYLRKEGIAKGYPGDGGHRPKGYRIRGGERVCLRECGEVLVRGLRRCCYCYERGNRDMGNAGMEF